MELKFKNFFVCFVKRWFDKKNGNTYHSVEIYEKEKLLTKVDFAYGYGTAYEQTILEELIKHGFYKKSDCMSSLRRTVKEIHGDDLLVFVADVSSKKDL